MENQDYRDILHHLRKEVRKRELASLDEWIMADFQPSRNSGEDLLRYINMLSKSLRERSSSGYGKILKNFRKSVKTEDGKEIKGVKVVLSEDEQRLYRIREVNLQLGPDYSELISRLEGISIEIENDMDLNNGPSFNP